MNTITPELIEQFTVNFVPMLSELNDILKESDELRENRETIIRDFVRAFLIEDGSKFEENLDILVSLLDAITSDKAKKFKVLSYLKDSLPFIKWMNKAYALMSDDKKKEINDFWETTCDMFEDNEDQDSDSDDSNTYKTEVLLSNNHSDELKEFINNARNSGDYDSLNAALAFIWRYSAKGTSLLKQMPTKSELMLTIKNRLSKQRSLFEEQNIEPNAFIMMIGPDDWEPDEEFMKKVVSRIAELVSANEGKTIITSIFADGTICKIDDILRDPTIECENPYKKQNMFGDERFTNVELSAKTTQTKEPQKDKLSELLDELENKNNKELKQNPSTIGSSCSQNSRIDSSPLSPAEEVLNEFKENKIGAEFISDPNEKGEIYLFPTIQCVLTDKKSVVAVKADSKEDALEKYKSFRKAHKVIPEDSVSNYQVATMFGVYSSEDNFKNTLTKEPMLYYSEKTNTVGEIKNIDRNIEDYTDFYAQKE